MVTISLCMIVKNEEAVLARCLDSVKELVDEVIIVDTGSNDRTKEIAAAYGRVYAFPWCDDFSAARNFSFSKASMEYCMWLDADDVIAPADRDTFRSLKETLDPAVDVVMLPYQIAFDAAGKPTFSYFRERLLRNGRGFQWQGAVHECIAPCGRIEYGNAAVQHRKQGPGDPDRNLRLYEKQLAQGKALDARGLFYYARELLAHKRYADAERAFSEFLPRPDGWLENRIEACRQLAECRLALGEQEQALQALLDSFAMDTPRAETCCALGSLLIGKGKYAQAAFWYETALRIPRDSRTGGFVLEDCYGYLPCIQLCLCYDRLGEYARAEEMNERAAGCRADSAAVAYNRAYFADRRSRA